MASFRFSISRYVAKWGRGSTCDLKPEICNQIVCPGFISSTSTFGANFCSSLGLPVSTGNVPKCMGMMVFACSRFAAYAASRGDIGVMIADREHGDVGRVQVVDDFHVTEDVSVARVIDLHAIFKFDDEADRFPAVENLVAILNAAGVVGMHHGDLDISNFDRASFVHLDQILQAFFAQPAREFRDGHHRGLVPGTNLDRVADVIAVRRGSRASHPAS